MKELTVIIPIHKVDDNILAMLQTAVASFNNANTDNESVLMLSLGKGVDPEQFSCESLGVARLETVTSSKSDFCTLINVAAKACKTKYFSILEFDDTYTPYWFNKVEEYLKVTDDISIYLPLTEVVIDGEQDKGPIGYVNEAVWASSFSNEIGYIDSDCLQDYMNFNTTGGIFKTEDFLAIGGLKASMKLSFWYEFLLRATYQSKKIFVVPKVGYVHLLGREDSVSDVYNKTMKSEEADWWIDLAKKEFYFKSDRKKTYEE